MSNLNSISIKTKHLKCFGSEEQGFDKILPINVIIGRNNSGKSTLLDLIEFAVTEQSITHLGHKGNSPEFYFSHPLALEVLKNIFGATSSWGLKWADRQIKWQYMPKKEIVSIEKKIGSNEDFPRGHYHNVLERINNPLKQYKFKRISAERDIIPELAGSVDIKPNGSQATYAITQFLNRGDLPSDLIEKTLLSDLNKIFQPDSVFTRILVQENKIGDNRLWEIYLEEQNKGRIPLRQTGSGLKTILLVLLNIHLIPYIEKSDLDKYFFAFEELENNLHPALQRRLLLFLKNIAVEKKATFFFTTHSNVVIDLFSKDEEAQIIHVTHNGQEAFAKTITTYVEHCGVLDDLDVRASDLLQANGIIWLEGPSDRLYFNHWVKLWSGDTLHEGVHYQCVFYGGRLLAHLSADEENSEDAVKILNVNRNAIILIDSDKNAKRQYINDTKKRIIAEFGKFNGMAWVTAGKEVENYLPLDALKLHYEKSSLGALEPFEDFAEYLNTLKKDEGKKFTRNKVLYAENIIQNITKEVLVSVLDLENKMNEVIRRIKKWNNL